MNSLLRHAGSSSLTRDRSQGRCIGRVKLEPMDHQGSPRKMDILSVGHASNEQAFPWFVFSALSPLPSEILLVVKASCHYSFLFKSSPPPLRKISCSFFIFSKSFAHKYTTFLTSLVDGKETVCNAGDPVSIPGSGRSPREGNGYPLQYSCLENSINRWAWWGTAHGVTKSQTRNN